MRGDSMATRTADARASRKSAKSSGTKSRTTAKRVARPKLPAVAQPQFVGMLGGLVLAMVLGGLGFVVSVFWVGAIVVMAILLGLTVAERRSGRKETGVVTEVVAAVVDEMQGISESAARLKN
jgi:hypothetical protein